MACVRICGFVAAVCSARVRPYGFVAAFCLGSRLSFFLCQEKRDGLRYLAFLFRRVEIAIRTFSRCRRGYLPLRVHFGFGRFFVAIPTGLPGTRGTGNGVRENGGWRCGLCAFLRNRIGLAGLSAGSTLGAARPQTCAKESSTLWTLLTLRRGWGGAYSRQTCAKESKVEAALRPLWTLFI